MIVDCDECGIDDDENVIDAFNDDDDYDIDETDDNYDGDDDTEEYDKIVTDDRNHRKNGCAVSSTVRQFDT